MTAKKTRFKARWGTMSHSEMPRAAASGMADDQCNCTTAHIDPNCYCPPDSPKGRASSGGAAAPHALTHSHESLGSFTRNLSAMSLDDARDGEKPPGRVSPDVRGSALTEAARTLSNISADAGVAPASAPAPYAPLAPPSAPWPPAAAPKAAAAPPWAPAPASAPAPWPPATSPRYRATDEALRRERALTFDESDGHAMKVDACDACPYCHDTCADPDCPRCAVWRLRPRKMCRGCAVFSPCEVRRHASAESCWLVAGRDVFDVTSFLPRHPAGTRSIVRKAGGADCTEDLGFHSAKAQKLWMQHKIGRLEPCGAEKNPDNGCAVA